MGKLEQLQKKYASLEQDKKNAENERNTFQNELESMKNKTKNRHSQEFWDDIGNKLKIDTDSIKDWMKTGTITENDTDSKGYNLLHLAARHGNYEIAKLCINKGYDLKAKDKSG